MCGSSWKKVDWSPKIWLFLGSNNCTNGTLSVYLMAIWHRWWYCFHPWANLPSLLCVISLFYLYTLLPQTPTINGSFSCSTYWLRSEIDNDCNLQNDIQQTGNTHLYENNFKGDTLKCLQVQILYSNKYYRNLGSRIKDSLLTLFNLMLHSFLQDKRLQKYWKTAKPLSCWYSLEGSCRVLSGE